MKIRALVLAALVGTVPSFAVQAVPFASPVLVQVPVPASLQGLPDAKLIKTCTLVAGLVAQGAAKVLAGMNENEEATSHYLATARGYALASLTWFHSTEEFGSREFDKIVEDWQALPLSQSLEQANYCQRAGALRYRQLPLVEQEQVRDEADQMMQAFRTSVN